MAIRLSGINSGLDTDAIVQELVSAYSLKTEKYEKQQTKLEWKQEAWKSLNTKIYGLYTNVSNLRYSSAYNLKKTTVSDNTKASVSASSDAVTGTQKLNILKTAQASYLTGGYLGDNVSNTTTLKELGYTGENTTIKVKTADGEETEIEITANTKISELVSKFKSAGLNANFDANNGRIFLSAKESGAAADFDLVADDSDAYAALSALGLASADDAAEAGTSLDSSKYATKIEGQDAVITLNGVEYTNSDNTFTINGITIEAQGVTGAGDENAITINTSVDTQGIYDKIKDFLTEYNNVINEITKLYNAEAATDYEPLTDDEKDAMSDEQIEKWEEKIKSALLRRDTSLGTVMNAMINSMAQTIEIDGQKMSLGSFGISTLGFLNAAENEQYAYHIDGDEDDENTSGNTDKLMAAIQNNPDQVVDFMKQLATNLYTAIDTKMKSTELSSAYKVYNDKEMDSELDDIADLIEKWEDKIAEQEDYYYGKFSDMEVALSKLNSQTSALSGLLGTS